MILGASTNQYNNPQSVNAATVPEDVFFAWLLSRPRGTNIVAAASQEIIKLEAFAGKHAGAKRLHELFCALIEESQRPELSSASRVPQ
ncbi:hypothetical protein [Phyllobacterium sp. 22552]|uniref:hypothetical protein n=1 Tax=Phyllobacterium sp. 22552 TaxID=3453941 RepID=UPI003F87B3E7